MKLIMMTLNAEINKNLDEIKLWYYNSTKL